MKIMLTVVLLMGDGDMFHQQVEVFSNMSACLAVAEDVAETMFLDSYDAVDYTYVCAVKTREA